MTRDDIINEIRFMSAEDLEDFIEKFEDWSNVKRYHKLFLKNLKKYEKNPTIDNLFSVVGNNLLSKKCVIKEIRKNKDNTSIWVEFTKAPPMSGSMSFDFSDWSTFVRKYN